MNKQRKEKVLELIRQASYVLAITDHNKHSVYNFNWGNLTGLCTAAAAAGISTIDIDVAQNQGKADVYLRK